jgi:hypothetical protein
LCFLWILLRIFVSVRDFGMTGMGDTAGDELTKRTFLSNENGDESEGSQGNIQSTSGRCCAALKAI